MKKIYLLLTLVLVLLLSSCQTDKPKTFEVNFYADNVLLKSEKVQSGQSATAPDASTKEGYTFIKWDKEFINVTKDLEVNAIFDAVRYRVYFVSDGQQMGQVSYVEHGKKATPPIVTPSKEGYKFIGWDKPLENILSDTTFNAVFDEVKERYTLTLSDGVTANTELTNLLYNQKVTITVTTPEVKELVEVKLNNQVISLLEDNTYTFKITSDTNVEAVFRENEKPSTVQREVDRAVQEREAAGEVSVLVVPPMLRATLARFLKNHFPQIGILSSMEIPDDRVLKMAAVIGGNGTA